MWFFIYESPLKQRAVFKQRLARQSAHKTRRLNVLRLFLKAATTYNLLARLGCSYIKGATRNAALPECQGT
jgi:hypothetical protein